MAKKKEVYHVKPLTEPANKKSRLNLRTLKFYTG